MALSRREALLLGGVGAAAAVAGGVAGVLTLQARSGAAELLGARYPDLSGQTRRLREWQGRALLCNFWATWCAPCREEIPLLVAAKQQHPSSSLEIIGIGIDQVDKIREFTATFKINYPVLVADATAIELMRKLGNQAGGLPYTVAIDRRGSIRQRHLGPLTSPGLGEILAGILE